MVELSNWENTFSGTSAPGDYGFDGGFLKGKSAKDVADLKLKEIKNGSSLFYVRYLFSLIFIA